MIFGKVADLPNVNRILLQQISFVAIGLCTMLLTAAPFFTGFEWESMIISALCLGKDLFRNGRNTNLYIPQIGTLNTDLIFQLFHSFFKFFGSKYIPYSIENYGSKSRLLYYLKLFKILGLLGLYFDAAVVFVSNF